LGPGSPLSASIAASFIEAAMSSVAAPSRSPRSMSFFTSRSLTRFAAGMSFARSYALRASDSFPARS
jgi:hypothetical protein